MTWQISPPKKDIFWEKNKFPEKKDGFSEKKGGFPERKIDFLRKRMDFFEEKIDFLTEKLDFPIKNYWISQKWTLTIADNLDYFWWIWQFCQLWEFLTTLTIPETCDFWDIDYNFDNWEPEFMTVFVTWQSRVTLDSIRNSCDVFYEPFL